MRKKVVVGRRAGLGNTKPVLLGHVEFYVVVDGTKNPEVNDSQLCALVSHEAQLDATHR